MTLEELESKIQELLIDFEDEHGGRVHAVTVDTRHANLVIEVHLR
jgi:hypothetical protein